jgi:hypothetical protein
MVDYALRIERSFPRIASHSRSSSSRSLESSLIARPSFLKSAWSVTCKMTVRNIDHAHGYTLIQFGGRKAVERRKKIQSRPEQRRKLEAVQAYLFEGRKRSRNEVKALGEDEFDGEGMSSMLLPDPGYSEEALVRAIGWLNGGYKNRDERGWYVRNRWHEFQDYVGGWRKQLRLEMRNSKDPHNRGEARALVTLANAWAAGDLPALRTCLECGAYFLAKRSNQQFCNGECRSTFYHDRETLFPEYKTRKAREAKLRRKRAKEKALRQYVRNIISMYGKMPQSQLDARLASAARKFKVTLAAVKRIARSLSPTKDGVLLADSHERSVASGKH